jgi:hypothetical protein
VSTPGVTRFYASFCEFSHFSVSHLGLSFAAESAAKHGPKCDRFPDAVPTFGRTLSSTLRRHRDAELTNSVETPPVSRPSLLFRRSFTSIMTQETTENGSLFWH